VDDCEKLKNWDALTKAERLDLFQDMLARMANDYDVPVPEAVIGAPPDNPETPQDESTLPAGYDPSTNEMYFNNLSEWTYKDDPSSLFHSAGHEFAHELFDENYAEGYDLTTAEGRKEFNDDSEAYADEYENQLGEEVDDHCNETPPPQSPGTPDTGNEPWELPPGQEYA
jgi:hypothetical protein